MQCKDIPDAPLLAWLCRQTRPATWFCLPKDMRHMPDVSDAMPTGVPPKLALAKMKNLIKRGFVSGCGCGCRGDFEITELGRIAALKEKE